MPPPLRNFWLTRTISGRHLLEYAISFMPIRAFFARYARSFSAMRVSYAQYANYLPEKDLSPMDTRLIIAVYACYLAGDNRNDTSEITGMISRIIRQ